MEVLSNSNCVFNGNVEFSGNYATLGGGIKTKGHSYCVFSGNSEFSDNSAADSGGGVDVYGNSYYTFSTHVDFFGNRAARYGGGINVMTNSNCTFNGSVGFYDKSTGGGMEGRGDFHFENNTAQYGGGLALSGGSVLYFPTGFNNYSRLTIQFISNHAERYGGAIWVENTPYCTNDERDECFIRFEHYNDSSWLPIVTAIHNTAIAGRNIYYGGNISNCMHSIEALMPFLNDSNSESHQILCRCNSSEQENCSISNEHIEVFSGEQLELTLVKDGQQHETALSVVLDPSHVGYGSVTQSAKGNCSVLTITSNKPSVQLMLHSKSMCTNTSLFALTVNIKPCPPGFMLHSETKSCTCDDNLKKLDNNIECNINSQSFSHQHGVWIGYIQSNNTLIYHPHCPFDYCLQELNTFTLNSTDDQCRYNRSGLICGACKEGYSLTLGGSKCRECSHVYIVLFIPLALAGVVLVLFLLTFKLTVSVGTINGLIFFANIIGTNSSIFLPSESTVVLRVFIAWLNLDLGIDTCLFDGLDKYMKVCLQFVFPFYVFTLIAIILFLSQRSTLMTKFLGSDPVAVLATLILLAYTKLFRAVLTVMSYTYINGFDGSSIVVWLCDGNIRYRSGKHVVLVIFALLITLLLIIPYTVILLFAPYLQRYSKNRVLFWVNDYRLKSFLHSYYAPLKDKYRSWIGFLLVLRLCLLIVFVFNSLGDPSINLFAIAAAVILLLCWRVLSGIFYSNWFHDALELFFIMKLGLFSVATLYIRNTGGNQRALTDTLVGVAFIVFVAITVYHGWRQLTDSRWWRLTLKPKMQKYIHTKNAESLNVREDNEILCEEAQTPQEIPTTTIELREPVLEYCDN